MARDLARRKREEEDRQTFEEEMCAWRQAVSGDEYASVYFELLDESHKLLTAAGELAGRCWEGQISELEALRQLRERFPGFSTDTYRSAFAYGMRGVTR